MQDLINFLDNSPTAFQATHNIKEELLKNGYIELDEKKIFNIEKNNKYFVKRNDSSLIAFNVGKNLENASLKVCASHCDSPTFKIKPNSTFYENGYLKLNVEVYGGTIYYPWLDRPLSIAGRIVVKEDGKLKTVLYDYKKPFCLIPSEAIHQNREVNDDLRLNPQIDMLPICSLKKGDLKEFLHNELNLEILNYELYLYPTQKAYVWGMSNEFMSSSRLDDLECAYGTLNGFINNFDDNSINVYCLFDNEEIGSLTKQGAGSDFLFNTLHRICDSLNIDYYSLLARGMMLSCDNAQGIHPAHYEKFDVHNCARLNEGIVIKYNARGAYASEALGSSILIDQLNRNNIKYQLFANRSDVKGGTTLGNISNGHVSLITVDIGLAQLAMHSAFETCGSRDYKLLINCIKNFYSEELNI